MAEVLPAVLRDRAADFWEELTADQQKSYPETKRPYWNISYPQKLAECIIQICTTGNKEIVNLQRILPEPFKI